MMEPKIRVLFMIFLILMVSSVIAWADYPSRPATKAEISYYKTVLTTFGKAVPTGPEGWDETDRTKVEPLTRVALGTEKAPFFVNYYIAWQDTPRITAAEDKTVQALVSQQENQKPNPERDALNEKNEQLATEIGVAAEKGNMAKMQQLQKQIEAVQQKLNAIYAKEDNERNLSNRKLQPRDASLCVNIMANRTHLGFTDLVVKEAPVAGGQCFRMEGDYSPSHSWREGWTYVFLGKGWVFQQSEGGAMKFPVGQGIPHTVAQNIIVSVQAEKTRARSILAKVDWDGLKRLIGI